MSEKTICCPKCKSSQIATNDKGFSIVKAAAGAMLIGGVGLLGGVIGSKKIRLNCLSCGHSWSLKKTKASNQNPGPIDKVPVYNSSSTKNLSAKYSKNPLATMSEKIIKEQSERHTIVLTPSNENTNSTKSNNSNIDKAIYGGDYSQKKTVTYSPTNKNSKKYEIDPIQSSIEERLSKLSYLKDKNLISEDDYQKKKNEILDIL